MNSRVAAGGSVRGERWRWLSYVAMAFAGALLTFVGARAQQKATDQATFQSLIDAYCAAWSTLDANAPAKFYAKEDGLIFYDIAPFSYHGWKEYHDGVQKEIFANMAAGSLTAGKDLKVSRHGGLDDGVDAFFGKDQGRQEYRSGNPLHRNMGETRGELASCSRTLVGAHELRAIGLRSLGLSAR